MAVLNSEEAAVGEPAAAVLVQHPAAAGARWRKMAAAAVQVASLAAVTVRAAAKEAELWVAAALELQQKKTAAVAVAALAQAASAVPHVALEHSVAAGGAALARPAQSRCQHSAAPESAPAGQAGSTASKAAWKTAAAAHPQQRVASCAGRWEGRIGRVACKTWQVRGRSAAVAPSEFFTASGY